MKPILDGERGVALKLHTFTPRDGLYWERCPVCGLSEAAHRNTSVDPADLPELAYRCPDCVIRSEATHRIVTCSHREGANA